MALIAVLPTDVADELLRELRRDLEARGWRSEVSRGREQIVLALSGGDDPEALRGVFEGRVDADLLPILTGRDYRFLQLRRRFASWLVGALGVVFAVVLCIPGYLFVKPPPNQLAASDLVRAASAATMPLDADKPLTVDGQRVLLVRRADGSAFATGGRCTHLDGCLLEWDADRHQIICPCCGGAYDAYGNVIEGLPSIPLRRYPVERIGDDFFIRRKD